MTPEALQAAVGAALGPRVRGSKLDRGQLTIEVGASDLIPALTALRDEPALAFTILVDLLGLDYQGLGGMPWEGPLDRLASSLQGPVARVAGIVAIIFVGLGFAFSEGGSGMRKVLWVVAGLTIAFNAARWALPFLGFSGGLAI